MKKIVILTLTAFLFSMCTSNLQESKDLQTKNDSLQRLVVNKDSALYAVVNTFNEIENNLQSIKEKENIITATVQNSEDNCTREQKINNDINMIYDLMKENKNKVIYLQGQLKNAKIKNKDLENTIKNLQLRLTEKNAEILELRRSLLDLNLKIDELTYSLDSLNFDNQVKTELIKAQEEELNTAYYLFGSNKELKEFNIIDNKGSFFGTKKLNQDFKKEHFIKIDIRNKKTFIFDNAKKIKIITSHPSKSYTIYGEKPIDSLVINNVNDFWSISKYLVISINSKN
jgi:predicted  nucleic acid-binding Zn-ribbon protein